MELYEENKVIRYQCTKCNFKKTEKEFFKDAKVSNGLNSWCKACNIKARKKNSTEIKPPKVKEDAFSKKNDALLKETVKRIKLENKRVALYSPVLGVQKATELVTVYDNQQINEFIEFSVLERKALNYFFGNRGYFSKKEMYASSKRKFGQKGLAILVDRGLFQIKEY